ncbi:MAG: Eco57I restriction-modification methylase domain-containing protein [Candidatus Hodarchaeales archaeon]|jgi:type I restriction-modification system DNA methylase subunit
MGFDKKHKLEALSRKLWKSYNEKTNMEPKSWLPFLDFFFSNSSLQYFAESSDNTMGDLNLLGKADNLVIFLNVSERKYKFLLGDCIKLLKRSGFSKIEKIYIFVLSPSKSGLNFSFFSPKNKESNDTIKTIRFPQGRIPTYFQELIESEHEASPVKILQRLLDIHALEADFLSQGVKNIQISKVEQKECFIGYLTLLLLSSSLTDIDTFFDYLRKKLSNSKVITLGTYLTKLQDYKTQHSMKKDDIMKICTLLDDIGLNHFLIDRVLLKDLLQRYPYSLIEPSTVVQQVAITPLVLSKITENLFTSSSKKKKEGKYYTSSSNADFVVYLAVYRMLSNKLASIKPDDLFDWVFQDWGFVMEPFKGSMDLLSMLPTSLKVLDPACGSGTFLVSVIRLLTNLAVSGPTFGTNFFPIVEIFSVDPDRIAILVTRLRLIFLQLHELSEVSSPGLTERAQPPIRLDFSNINQGDFFFYKKIDKEKFDLILGNPPWVRHEDIGAGQSSEYKKLLQSQVKELSGETTFFDRKSDLYIYFCLMSLSLLENGGVLAFLTSNAWLEVKYGRTLQKFLLDPDKRIRTFEIIHRSGTRLWNQLGINSIILIAEKSIRDKTTVSHGTFTESQVNFSQIPLSSLKKGIITQKDYEDHYYRTELITREQLKQTHKWAGTFLRTSRSERKLLKRISKKGVPLSSLAGIRFGIKTGANAFFHLKSINEEPRADGNIYVENRVGYKALVEQKYLVPLMKSPTHVKGFIIPSSYFSGLLLFYCLDSPTQLKGSRAWQYIKWAETASVTIKQGKRSGTNIQGFSSIRSVEQRDHWYSLSKYPAPSLLWTKSYHDRAGCLYNQAQALPDQRFYGVTIAQDKYLPLIFTYLNSSLVWAQMEAQGNTNMGFGVLDTNVYWLKSLRIPVEALTETNQIMTLMEQLTKEKNRFSMLQFSQVREDIDNFYAKYFDLSNNSIKRLYDFILRSINNRIR